MPQRVFNNVHEHVRNRCENVISKVKNHAFLRNAWVGSFETLASMVKVTGHVTAHELRQFQRFASFGPWPHSLETSCCVTVSCERIYEFRLGLERKPQ